MNRIRLLAVFLSCLCLATTPAGAEPNASLMQEVMKEYQAGNYDKASALLAEDLQKNPEDGVAHYYLGLVKQKMGDDSDALNELEWAARLCPPEMISGLTKQAMDGKLDKLPKVPAVITPKADWLGMLGNSVSQMFGAPKQEPKITDSGDILMPPPVMFGSFDDLMNQGKQMVKKGATEVRKAQHGSQYRSWATTTMPMEDMMDLVDKSRSINAKKWASHSDGLRKFHNTTENTPEWDFWVQRFTRAFQHILTSYLFQDAKTEVRGKAACVFSVDKRGNLRGHIYASTGDSVLNTALVKTIQTMNQSRILEFPPNSHIEGYNFRMTWDFGRILNYITAYKAIRAAREKAELEAIIAKQTEAMLLKKKQEEADKAKAEKLKLLREKQIARAKARLAELNREIKTEVVGQILPPVRPAELDAVAMSIADPTLKKMNVPKDQRIDPFSNISDQQIMSWPDLNR